MVVNLLDNCAVYHEITCHHEDLKGLSMDSRIGAIKKHHLSRKPLFSGITGFAFPIGILSQIKNTGSRTWSHTVAALY